MTPNSNDNASINNILSKFTTPENKQNFEIPTELIEEIMNLLTSFLPKKLLGRFKNKIGKLSFDHLFTSMEMKSDEFGFNPTIAWYLRPFFQFLYYYYFRVETEGIFNIPVKKPAILIANHAGGIPYDGVMIHLAVYNKLSRKDFLRFLVHDFVFDLPMLGSMLLRLGGVRAKLDDALRILKRGQLLLIFPEGIQGIGKLYDDRYKLKQFGHGGFVKLAILTGAPIIPTAVIGSEEIHPILWTSKGLGNPLGLPYLPLTPTFPWLGPLGMIPLPSKWRIICGKPISFAHHKPSDAKNNALVMKLTNEVRGIVQDMVNDGLARRESVWY